MSDELTAEVRDTMARAEAAEARLAEAERQRAVWFGENSRAQARLANVEAARVAEARAYRADRREWREREEQHLDRLDAATRRAEAAEARLANVEAVLNKWNPPDDVQHMLLRALYQQVRAALAPTPTEGPAYSDGERERVYIEKHQP